MGLALKDKQCFSHGQVYVAMSRVQTIDGIKIISPQTCKGGDDDFIINVVYHELLDTQIAPRQQHFDEDEIQRAHCSRIFPLPNEQEYTQAGASGNAPALDSEPEIDLPC